MKLKGDQKHKNEAEWGSKTQKDKFINKCGVCDIAKNAKNQQKGIISSLEVRIG